MFICLVRFSSLFSLLLWRIGSGSSAGLVNQLHNKMSPAPAQINWEMSIVKWVWITAFQVRIQQNLSTVPTCPLLLRLVPCSLQVYPCLPQGSLLSQVYELGGVHIGIPGESDCNSFLLLIDPHVRCCHRYLVLSNFLRILMILLRPAYSENGWIILVCEGCLEV